MLTVILVVANWVLLSRQPATNPAPVNPTATTQSVLGQTTKTVGCVTVNGLPDNACTPGEEDPRVTQDNIGSTICVSGYSASIRPPETVTNKIKVERMSAYGDADSLSNYELDHLISLELGGCPDCVGNLWPEPYNGALGAHQKDKVENYLHKKVCSGAISLHDAQVEIANNWEAVYASLPQK